MPSCNGGSVKYPNVVTMMSHPRPQVRVFCAIGLASPCGSQRTICAPRGRIVNDFEHRRAFPRPEAPLPRQHRHVRGQIPGRLRIRHPIHTVGKHPHLHPGAIDAESGARHIGAVRGIAFGAHAAGVIFRPGAFPDKTHVRATGQGFDKSQRNPGPNRVEPRMAVQHRSARLADKIQQLRADGSRDVHFDGSRPIHRLAHPQVVNARGDHLVAAALDRIQQLRVELQLGRRARSLLV